MTSQRKSLDAVFGHSASSKTADWRLNCTLSAGAQEWARRFAQQATRPCKDQRSDSCTMYSEFSDDDDNDDLIFALDDDYRKKSEKK